VDCRGSMLKWQRDAVGDRVEYHVQANSGLVRGNIF
jgi:hypothetical protein